MGQSFASLTCHIVFSTKNREPLIPKEIAPRLYSYIGGILKETKSVLLSAGGIADHVHLLASLGREVSMAEALRRIKAHSSKWLHETFAELRHFAWQSGYGAFSVSVANVAAVKHYLANQEQHHRRRAFKAEFLDFLKTHGIEGDEKYLWD